MSDFQIGYSDVFAGRNTSGYGYNGVLDVETHGNLKPMLPMIYRTNSNNLNRGQSPIGQPSPLGARLQLGDLTDPTNPSYFRFNAKGKSLGLIYGVDSGDMSAATSNYFQDSLVCIDGEDFIPTRTVEWQNSITPYTANNRALYTAVFDDLGSESYMVEVRTPGDRTYAPLTSITRSGTTATATCTGNNSFLVGQVVNILGASDALYNGLQTITASTPGAAGTFTYTMTGTPASNASGTLTVGTPNRFVVYAVLMDDKYIGDYGGRVHLNYSVGTVPTSLGTVSSWSNVGSRPFALSQVDITNTTAGALTCLMQIDAANQSHYKTIAANDTATLFVSNSPTVVDPTTIKLQAGGSGLRYTILGTAGF